MLGRAYSSHALRRVWGHVQVACSDGLGSSPGRQPRHGIRLASVYVDGSDPLLHQSCQGVCFSDGAAVFVSSFSRARGCLACEEVRWFISNAPSDWLLHVYDGLVAKV